MKKFAVLTPSGLPCFEADSRRTCNAYIRQAELKGAVPGSLKVVQL